MYIFLIVTPLLCASGILEEIISNLLIQANNVADKQMELPPHNLLLYNSELLPGMKHLTYNPAGKLYVCNLNVTDFLTNML